MPVLEVDGLLWNVEYGTHDEIGPWHEQELTPQVLDLLPEGGVFLDVGAHVGHYTLRAARKASVVYAVEPNPSTAKRLRENLALNSLTNVHVIEIAAWDGVGRFGIQRVHESYERDGSNRILPSENGPIWGAKLDDAMNQFPLRPDRLDLIKIDVEGADLHAIDGMQGLIGKHQPLLFIEDHSYLGYYEWPELTARILRLGYVAEKVIWGNATYWKCTPASPELESSESPERASRRIEVRMSELLFSSARQLRRLSRMPRLSPRHAV